MKILLFGEGGQAGWELQRSLVLLGETVALNRRNPAPCGDLGDLDGIAETICMVAPDIVVNAAAYNAVDRAESEPAAARTINALAPGIMAQESKRSGALLVHYSSDYVFDGSGDQPWTESSPANPVNVYGQTKLDGEEAIRNSGCRHLIFRTSRVYAARGNNFARTMLRLAQQQDQLHVVDDQIGTPTGAELLADVTAQAIRIALQRPDADGLYHLVANGHASWYDYARFVIEFARCAGVDITVDPDAIKAVPSSAYATPAARPKNARLDTSKLQTAFGLHLPDWQSGVSRMLTEILQR